MHGKVDPSALQPHKVHGRAVVDVEVRQLACAVQSHALENDHQMRGLESHRSLPPYERPAVVVCAVQACAKAVILRVLPYSGEGSTAISRAVLPTVSESFARMLPLFA